MSTPTISRSGHIAYETQFVPVAAGTTSGGGHAGHDTQTRIALAGDTSTDFRSGHRSDDTQSRHAAAGQTSSTGHTRFDAQASSARVGNTPEDGSAATKHAALPKIVTSLFDPFLALAADILDDAEDSRIANENRLRQLTRAETDSDGEERGFGLDESHPDVARVAALVELLKQIEHNATLNLARLLRQHPLGPWIKAQKGIGDKQGARLLAVIGDPYINLTTGEIRTVSQLWAYCGHGDPARRRFKGMTQADLFQLGNPVAKSRLWLISCACLKAQGPYADVYYARKAVNEGREHATDCKRCGPSGKPALAGSPWADAHRHADALRITGKEILRDLWLEAKRIHEGENQ